jgi:hypothetical protein
MINPSAQGWIDKYFVEQNWSTDFIEFNEIDFYDSLKNTGFIFGHIVSISTPNKINTDKWHTIEISKVSLLTALFKIHSCYNQSINTNKFIEDCAQFYKIIQPKNNSFFGLNSSNSLSFQLEEHIDLRVKTNDDIFSKNFSHVITNALVFIDVLAFHKYLKYQTISKKYFSQIEEIVTQVVSLSLNSKSNKSTHDELLQKLFESSVRYSKFELNNLQSIESLDLSYLEESIEKLYIIDLAGISLWSDEKVENEERYFLFKLGESLNISEEIVLKCITFINYFISTYKHEIPYFNYSNPVKHFYENTTDYVKILISRNKNRLIKEIRESKELMQLLAKSTVKDLDAKEKKKIKKQILDICKSVPSFTIFLLPGGSLLLPILIKFIPKMLPSAFNENLDEE